MCVERGRGSHGLVKRLSHVSPRVKPVRVECGHGGHHVGLGRRRRRVGPWVVVQRRCLGRVVAVLERRLHGLVRPAWQDRVGRVVVVEELVGRQLLATGSFVGEQSKRRHVLRHGHRVR